jgi:DNA-binding transcriptional LysR family regulator
MRDHVLRRLKLSDLRLLRAVAEAGGMAKAASHLNITQPAVSKAITALEKTMGVPLLDRTPHGIVPTIYGEVLLSGTAAVFDDLSQSINQIEFLNDPTVGDLRIGTIEHLTAGFLPAVINRLSQSYPRVDFHVDELSLRTLQYRALRERSVEFVLSRLTQVPLEPDMNVEILFDDPVFLAVGAKSPWAKRRRVTLADLVSEPWTHPPYTAIVGPVLVEAFRSQGLEPPHGVSCLNMQMHKALLATGRYVAALPTSLLSFAPEQWSIKRLPIELPQPPAPVGIISLKNKTMSPIANLFLQCARQIAKQSKGFRV